MLDRIHTLWETSQKTHCRSRALSLAAVRKCRLTIKGKSLYRLEINSLLPNKNEKDNVIKAEYTERMTIFEEGKQNTPPRL